MTSYSSGGAHRAGYPTPSKSNGEYRLAGAARAGGADAVDESATNRDG